MCICYMLHKLCLVPLAKNLLSHNRKTAHHLWIVGIEAQLCYEERLPMGFYLNASYGKFGMNDIDLYLN